MPENNEFLQQQQRAVERMREMSAHAAPSAQNPHSMPPTPPFIRMPRNSSAAPSSAASHTPNQNTDTPPAKSEPSAPAPRSAGIADFAFLEKLRTEPDLPLILGLLLLLWNDNADKKLMLALAYIMM